MPKKESSGRQYLKLRESREENVAKERERKMKSNLEERTGIIKESYIAGVTELR
jgi:hypothetical protein